MGGGFGYRPLFWQNKMPYDEVMKKWKAGALHSGGPGGPVVKNQAQAVAIMESEKKKADAGDAEYQAHPMRESLGPRKKKEA